MNLHRLSTSHHSPPVNAPTRSHTEIHMPARTRPLRQRLWPRTLGRRVERAYRVPWRVSDRVGDFTTSAGTVESSDLIGSSSPTQSSSRIGPSSPTQSSAVELTNESRERLRFVRFALASGDDRGSLSLSLPRHIEPGESIRVNVRPPASQDALLTVRWYRPDGREYLWLVSF